ncbi:hypothetical protein D3C78_1245570 [compost metagenome]
MTVVPVVRTAPTAGKSPLRMAQSPALSPVKGTEATWANPAAMAVTCSQRSTSSSFDSPCTSTSSAQAARSSILIKSGKPGLPATERRERPSISSTAATGALFRREVARQACSASRNTSRAEALWGYSGTVSSTTSAIKPRVPSEPIIRWVRISMGSSWSSRALMA